MLFVHLTDVRHVARIRRYGLRMTRSRFGTGVFCVPVFEIERERDMEFEECPGVWREWKEGSSVKTSALLWRWYMRDKRIRRPVAIYFRLPVRFWPADLYILFPERTGPVFLKRCAKARIPLSSAVWPDWDRHRQIREGFYCSEFHLQVQSQAHLGIILNIYIGIGIKYEFPISDDLELLIRHPIPGKLIHRIEPLSQRNITFRKKKAKMHLLRMDRRAGTLADE